MKKNIILVIVSLAIGVSVISLVWLREKQPANFLSPLSSLKKNPKPKPLIKYEFKNLKERGGKSSKIVLEKKLNSSQNNFDSYLFSYLSDGRKITGLANIPTGEKKFPVVIMLKGYVDQLKYQTGVGTKHAGEFYAQNGFITLAPDFLGYGGSEMPPNNVWEERFLRLTSVMDLLASVETLAKADPQKICLWGHSNGGMIALSVLEISGGNYPTALWSAVAKYFPYDILYYTDEFDDGGRALRKNLAEFEKDYQTDKYSFSQYLDWIQAPIQIHQGGSDKYVPLKWSADLVKDLRALNKEVSYFVYPRANHQMKSDWSKVVKRDLDFFQKQLEE